jgi:hypothetical protein
VKTNLTLSIEEDLLLDARKVALDRRTTVNQLVREYLADLTARPELSAEQAAALERLRSIFTSGLVDVGPRTWSREDLYDRSL